MTTTEPVTETLCSQLLDKHADSKLTAVQAEGTLTYAELDQLVETAARHLSTLGIDRGKRVLLLLPNSPEYLVSILAVTSLGAVAVPVPMDAGPVRLAYIAQTTQPHLSIIFDGDDTPPPSDRVVRIRVEMSGPEVVLSGSGEALDPQPRTRAETDDPAFILFSSGSTGQPKGVLLRHRHLLATARLLATGCGLGQDHRELLISRMCHTDGWQRAAATLLAGGRLVLPQGPLSVTGLLEDLKEHGITGFFIPTPLLRYTLKTSPDKVREATATCRTIEIGSAPLTSSEVHELMELIPHARIILHFGLTECSRALLLDAREHPDKLDTVGVAAPGVEVAIRGDDGRHLGPGEPGQILLRGLQRTDSYWGRPDLAEKSFVDGWLHTGDYGSLDGEGFLTFRGRRDELMMSAGYAFYPAEVETELGAVDGVLEYLIAGVADQQGIVDQEPWAFVVPRDPEGWSAGEFLSVARQRLPRHMVPRRVITVPSLPVSASGKPSRRQTIELYGDGGE